MRRRHFCLGKIDESSFIVRNCKALEEFPINGMMGGGAIGQCVANIQNACSSAYRGTNNQFQRRSVVVCVGVCFRCSLVDSDMIVELHCPSASLLACKSKCLPKLVQVGLHSLRSTSNCGSHALVEDVRASLVEYGSYACYSAQVNCARSPCCLLALPSKSACNGDARSLPRRLNGLHGSKSCLTEA